MSWQQHQQQQCARIQPPPSTRLTNRETTWLPAAPSNPIQSNPLGSLVVAIIRVRHPANYMCTPTISIQAVGGQTRGRPACAVSMYVRAILPSRALSAAAATVDSDNDRRRQKPKRQGLLAARTAGSTAVSAVLVRRHAALRHRQQPASQPSLASLAKPTSLRQLTNQTPSAAYSGARENICPGGPAVVLVLAAMES